MAEPVDAEKLVAEEAVVEEAMPSAEKAPLAKGRITFAQYNLLAALCTSVFLSGCLSACLPACVWRPWLHVRLADAAFVPPPPTLQPPCWHPSCRPAWTSCTPPP